MSTQPNSTPQAPAEAPDKGVVCDALVSRLRKSAAHEAALGNTHANLLFEAAGQIDKLVDALSEAIAKRAATTEWRTDSPEVTGKPERWVRDDFCTRWRAALPANAADQRRSPEYPTNYRA